MSSLRPTIYFSAFSTTGLKPRSGKVDTSFSVRVLVEDSVKTWIVPLKAATMNQAALQAVRFGILAIHPEHRENLSIITDSAYVCRVLERKNDKYPFKAESNVDLIQETRRLFGSAKDATVRLAATDVVVLEMRKKVRDLGKRRLQ